MSLVQRLQGDLPQEWAQIDYRILEALLPLRTKTLYTGQDEIKIVNFQGIMTAEQRKMVDAILAGRWFLIKNGGVLAPARCGRCKSYKHPYLTLGCVEKPYNGLGEIVALIERQTQRGVARVVKSYRGQGQRHAVRQGVDKPLYDKELTAAEFGGIVPITPQEAAKYIDKINDKGYRWRGPYPDLSAAA